MKYLAASVLLLCAPGIFAAEKARSPFEDKFRLTIGAFSNLTDTQLQIDEDDGTVGTLVSGENDLGLRDRTLMADVEVEMRLRPRHRVRLNYFALDRRQQKVLTRQIEFGEETYLLNDLTESRLAISNFSTTYTYLFVRRPKFEMGASLGLQMYSFEGEISVPARLVEEDESETGPVPILGLEASAIISSRWHLEARVEYLGVEIDEVKAHLKNLKGGIFYRFNNNVTTGLAYAVYNSEVRSTEPGSSGRWDFDNRGGELIFRVSF